MRVLVAVASRHGATQGIAVRIAERLRADGHPAEARRVSEPVDVSGYSGFVVGSSVYLGRWEKEALAFVDRNRSVLAASPVWLFSSGPLGADVPDAEGRDKREAAIPTDIPELTGAIRPRDHRVFFGALNPDDLPLIPRLMRLLPAGRKLLEEGDFRDWTEIDAWTDAIAAELSRSPAGAEAAAGAGAAG